MCSLRFYRMWNHKAGLLFLSAVLTLDMPNSRNSAKQHHVELTMELVPMASSLPLLTKMYYMSQHEHNKLIVAAFSGPPVCCFHQK